MQVCDQLISVGLLSYAGGIALVIAESKMAATASVLAVVACNVLQVFSIVFGLALFASGFSLRSEGDSPENRLKAGALGVGMFLVNVPIFVLLCGLGFALRIPYHRL